MGNHTAPKGQVYVCGVCGKRSRNKYGDQPIDHGWDINCMMHAVLVYENSTQLGENSRVIKADAVETVQENLQRFNMTPTLPNEPFVFDDCGPRGNPESVNYVSKLMEQLFQYRKANHANSRS